MVNRVKARQLLHAKRLAGKSAEQARAEVSTELDCPMVDLLFVDYAYLSADTSADCSPSVSTYDTGTASYDTSPSSETGSAPSYDGSC